MRLHFSTTTGAALLLVGFALLDTATGRWPARPDVQEPPPGRRLAPAEQLALQHCREHVSMVHDVHWAAACMRNPLEDSPECTLPDEQAAPLNDARDAAEAQCLHDATAGHRASARWGAAVLR